MAAEQHHLIPADFVPGNLKAGEASGYVWVTRPPLPPKPETHQEEHGTVASNETERTTFPSAEELVTTARGELRAFYGKDFAVPTPPEVLFEDAENFARLGIKGLEIFYQPSYTFDPKTELGTRNRNEIPGWKEGNGVKPEAYFWQLIKEAKLPPESATVPEGWILGDKRVKPKYQNGQQSYGDDAFMEVKVMGDLRRAGRIDRYTYVPDNSRFGASPTEIEQVIIPHFARITGARGIVEYPTLLGFNSRENMVRPESGKTDTAEWFSDKAFGGRNRLFGGRSGLGGLAYVNDWLADYRSGSIGVRLQVRYPSKPKA